jgi:hypothetical protein
LVFLYIIIYYIFSPLLLQCCSGFSISSESGSGSGSKVLIPKKWRKYSWKKIYLFLIKNCNLIVSRPPWRTSKLQEKPLALKRDHPALQKKEIYWLSSIFVGHFCPPGSNPDPDCASRLRDLVDAESIRTRIHNTA